MIFHLSASMNRDFVLPPRRRFSREEKRRNAELEYARNNWLGKKDLRLVHKLKEHDAEMRWLAELFPLELLVEDEVPKEVVQQRLSEWCAAHPKDARAFAYLADARYDETSFEKAVSMGDAWAMGLAILLFSVSDERRFCLASASAEQGDARGTYLLAQFVRCGRGCEKDEMLADELLERAAELGCYDAYVTFLNSEKNPAEKVKLLTIFFGVHSFNISVLESALDAVFLCYASGGSCGDAIFEAGEVLKGNVNVGKGEIFGLERNPTRIRVCNQAVTMYDGWCDAARELCVAWIVIAKRIRLNKDARKMIVMMVWEARSEARGNPLIDRTGKMKRNTE